MIPDPVKTHVILATDCSTEASKAVDIEGAIARTKESARPGIGSLERIGWRHRHEIPSLPNLFPKVRN
jgi:hypothetical protein